MISETLLRQMMPLAGRRLNAHLPYINEALDVGNLDTPERTAAFIAQLSHESKEYLYMEELADGSEYEGREDLGNLQPGDGVKFKGRCPMQITGRDNYRACGKALGLDLIKDPRLITLPKYGTLAATWYWNKHNLSKLADRGWFRVITKIINGGYNGWEDRLAYYERDRSLLGLPAYSQEGEVEDIKDFQSEHGLYVDGDAGQRTLAKLNA